MKRFMTYISICFFAIFGFLYMNRVIELSKSNNVILNTLNEYKKEYDCGCVEGNINELGLITGINGKSVNVNKSYSNMKGIGFKEDLIEYEQVECITSKDNNMDKYILSGNPSKNSISIVINIYSGKYYSQMINIFNELNIESNILINNNINTEHLNEYKNILIKGNSETDIDSLYNKLNDRNNLLYCVKTDDFDVIDTCNKHNISSIIMKDEIKMDLLYNIKHSLNKGDIIFIKENEFNLNELSATLKYTKSRGINIVSINELVV